MNRMRIIIMVFALGYIYWNYVDLPFQEKIAALEAEMNLQRMQLGRVKAENSSRTQSPGPRPQHPTAFFARLSASLPPAVLDSLSASCERTAGSISCENVSLLVSGALSELNQFGKKFDAGNEDVVVRSWSLTKMDGARYQLALDAAYLADPLDSSPINLPPPQVAKVESTIPQPAKPPAPKPAVAAVPRKPDFRVDGILSSTEGDGAMIEGRLVRVGERVNGYELLSIDPKSLLLKSRDGRKVRLAWSR